MGRVRIEPTTLGLKVDGSPSWALARAGKMAEERVALGVDLHSIEGTCLADHLPVCGKCTGIDLSSQFVQELRRPLDVGEEKGDGAARKLLKHASDHGRAAIFRLGRPLFGTGSAAAQACS